MTCGSIADGGNPGLPGAATDGESGDMNFEDGFRAPG